MGIKYPKSAARLLNREYVNRIGLDLSKEALRVSVDQRAMELLDIAVLTEYWDFIII